MFCPNCGEQSHEEWLPDNEDNEDGDLPEPAEYRCLMCGYTWYDESIYQR
jgi:rubrerythrin